MNIYTGLVVGGVSVLAIVWLVSVIYQNVWGGWKKDLDTKRKLTQEQRMEKLKEEHYE